ncbi:unnamed protein product [Chironomus riparius]|uniref:CD109 antigen n=1 Tax=Chironomus riparius TaxID=315576 RepID=A0A9N9RKF8_9DIPT|nr:unnamed protein product [Chironomus riparius]
MSQFLISFLAFSTFFHLITCDGYFTIVGSKVIRPDTDYHLAITSQGYKDPTSYKISINGTDDDGGNYQQSKDITISSDGTQTLIFDLKNLRQGDYKLDVMSTNGVEFHKSVDLDLNTKKHSVLVQTDKSIYKPGDKVQFRVLVLDSSTRPYLSTNVQVYVTDGGKNRIKQFDNVRLVKGVYQDELQLSDLPVMGTWLIHVKVDNGDESFKSFEVAEYVLPKYEVIVDSNPHVTFKDGKIRATVRAKYTYGKPVKGQATVSAYPVLWLGAVQPFIQDSIVRKVIQVDGKGSTEFDIRNELKIESDYERYVNIEAIFEEELTGRRQNGTTQITVHKYKYNVELIKEAENYKPGLPYNLNIRASYHDGSPLTDKANPVTVIVSYLYSEENATSTDYLLDDHGMAKVEIDVPVNATHLSIKAKYLDSDFYLGYITQAKSHSNQFIQARIVTEKPKLNQEISVDVIATEGMSQITYQVLGRGDVIVSKSLPVFGSNKYNFRFLGSFAMVPKATLVVYYIREDGEIISDHVKIELGDELNNFIDLELSQDQAKPGDDLSITISTKPNSYVGLLGVDQSVLLLKKGNDLEKSSVFEELGKFNEKTRFHRRYYGDFYGSYSDFDISGAVIVTNAKEEIHNVKVGYNPFQNEISKVKQIEFSTIRTETRPPLAGPYAFSRIPKPRWDHPRIHLKHGIENTWLFMNSFSAGYDGKTTISKKVPDTITSWIITGFSVDPLTGLGLTRQPSKFNVFQPFFVSTNLPYSIKRGEAVAIPIVVFNYMETDQRAEVRLYNDEKEFEFVEVSDDENNLNREKRAIETQRRKNVVIKSNSGSSVSFMIRPLKVGQIKIKVTATSQNAGDGLERMLIVVPEGVTHYKNKAVFVDLRNGNEVKANINIDIPKNAIPDSVHVEASAIGDVLGPSIENIDKLIKLPYGCGEQNMLNFVPNIVVLDYLTNLNKLNPDIESKAKKYMETGYQRELGYKHNDGSYSAFGKNDKSGSTWLTAFVAKSFNQASKYILVDKAVVKQALEFLKNVQSANGSFPEVGQVSHKDMQGGASKGIALTAYTLITFLENESFKDEYRNTINKALDYIVRNFNQLEDNYSLAIATYALELARHGSKDAFLAKFDSKATNKDGMKHWAKAVAESDEKSPWNLQPNAINIEMSAYGLQALLEAGLDSDAIPVMKWLVTQRNENGGFQSTQDTVVGLQALSKLATKIYVPNNNVYMNLEYSEGTAAQMSVNPGNTLILQKYDLPADTKEVNVTATGRGFAILQISYQYNLNVTGAWPRFVLDPQVNRLSNKDFLHLTVCTNFVPDNYTEKSNMAVMEVSFPSGFTFDVDTIPFLRDTQKVKKVETKEADTVVVVYFDEIERTELCPVFKAYRTHKVAKQRPAPVIIYDYYDSSRRATQFYSARPASLCDICEQEDCTEVCKIRASRRISNDTESGEFNRIKDSKGHANQMSSPLIILFMIAITKYILRV